MSFTCSVSCENGTTREKVLAKCSGKSPFSEYIGFQSDALEFSNCQMLGLTCGTTWQYDGRKGVKKLNSKKGF